MKKQLLIAAVAATMTSVAIADISITGKAKVNYKDKDIAGVTTNVISSEANLYITGTSGASTFYMELDNASGTAGSVTVEDAWMSTSVMGIDLKAGTWNGSDTIINADAARAAGKFSASTSFSGVKVTVDGSADANKAITFAGDVAGIAVSYKIGETANNFTASSSFNGVAIAVEKQSADAANSDKSSVVLSGSYGGFDLAYAVAKADSAVAITGSAALGNAASLGGSGVAAANGATVSGLVISTTLAGQSVKAKFVTVDTTNDTEFFELTVTHALPAGATLELTYSDIDTAGGTAADATIFDVELMVAF